MTVNPTLRKLALTAHIILSVGWLGAVVAYLALAIGGLTSPDGQMVRAAYLSMEFIGWYVIVPFSLAALVAGLVESVGTPWGLFRHWWVLAKFLLISSATIVLLMHMQAVTRMSGFASEITLSSTDFRALRIQLLVHAAGGLLVLIAATVVSVYKPWGMTPYGRRKHHERRKVSPAYVSSDSEPDVRPSPEAATRTPRWVYVVGLHAIALALLFVVMHLTTGGLGNH
jgi:hypothetical protein